MIKRLCFYEIKYLIQNLFFDVSLEFNDQNNEYSKQKQKQKNQKLNSHFEILCCCLCMLQSAPVVCGIGTFCSRRNALTLQLSHNTISMLSIQSLLNTCA